MLAVCGYVFADRPGQPGGINTMVSAEKKKSRKMTFSEKCICNSRKAPTPDYLQCIYSGRYSNMTEQGKLKVAN